jgi:hypothetical protein
MFRRQIQSTVAATMAATTICTTYAEAIPPPSNHTPRKHSLHRVKSHFAVFDYQVSGKRERVEEGSPGFGPEHHK